MMGIQCFDTGGAPYFDTNRRRNLHLVGRYIARDSDREGRYIMRIPSSLAPHNTVVAVKLYERRDNTGKPLYLTMLREGNRIDFRYFNSDRRNSSGPVPEIFIYTIGSVPAPESNFGVETIGEGGIRSFSSDYTSKILQVTSTYSEDHGLSSRNLGPRDQGVIVNSIPVGSFIASGLPSYYYDIDTVGLGVVDGNVRSLNIANVTSAIIGGQFQKQILSLTFVKLPDQYNTIPW